MNYQIAYSLSERVSSEPPYSGAPGPDEVRGGVYPSGMVVGSPIEIPSACGTAAILAPVASPKPTVALLNIRLESKLA